MVGVLGRPTRGCLKREPMSKKPSQEAPETERGSTRQGTTITAPTYGLRFEIPAAWVRWHDENGDEHPNLHLTPVELDAVKETTGDWDQEFAQVVNAILPFEQCVAHVGGDGWGPRGVSFSDLQVRAYVLGLTPDEIEARSRLQGAAVVESFTGMPTVPQHEHVGAWRRTVLKYRRMYGDYGAVAIVDLRPRRFGDRTVAFAFMYTDHTSHDDEIQALLDSVAFGGAYQDR
jgi:hypothetical protein